MSFPYDTPFTNNNKVDLDTFPAVPAINKMLATEVNPLISGVNALATAVTAGRFLGLAGEAAPDVAPAGGVRIKAGAAGPEFSFNGGAYAPIGGGGDTVSIEPFGSTPSDGGATNADGAITMQPCDGTHPGMVSEADQVLGAGVKTFSSPIRLTTSGDVAPTNDGDILLYSDGGDLSMRYIAGGDDAAMNIRYLINESSEHVGTYRFHNHPGSSDAPFGYVSGTEICGVPGPEGGLWDHGYETRPITATGQSDSSELTVSGIFERPLTLTCMVTLVLINVGDGINDNPLVMASTSLALKSPATLAVGDSLTLVWTGSKYVETGRSIAVVVIT